MRVRVPAGLLAVVLLTGCSPTTSGTATAVATGPVGELPGDVAGLGELVLTEVPAGLPRLPDDELDPPAGAKTVDDVAGYADDPDREAEVLTDYGYRWGWERFWRDGDELTSIFLDQFDGVPGAASYASDLARNDTEYYGGNPDREPDDLPAGCSLLTVDDPGEDTGLDGPAAFAWCSHGPFTVSVAVVSEDPDDALAELHDVLTRQLGHLPRG